MRERWAVAAVALPFVLGAAAAPSAAREVAFRFQDPAIVESSGLVAQGGLFVTVNDSGDTGRVFTVDPADGRTVGVTTWPAAPEDIEALAAAGAGSVWVGDIGDNNAARSSVSVTRVPVGVGDRSVPGETYELVYPGGAVDAETLMADPRTGRLLVASKRILGGSLFVAPERLSPDGPNRLREVGSVLPIATDGAFFPDGRHLVLRDYGRAVVYTYPGLRAIAEVDLPEQQQGEGIAVDRQGRVFVSSEGVRAPVLEVPLSAGVRRQVTPPPEPSASPSPSASADDAPDLSREGKELPEQEAQPREPWQWLIGTVLFVVAVGVLLRAVRPRRR
jgi:hypothetical protein